MPALHSRVSCSRSCPHTPGNDRGSRFMLQPAPLPPQVPPSVRTGEDAVRLFCSSSAKSGLIVYCNLNPDGPPHEYNPYDLMVVDRARADPRHHYVLTQARGKERVARVNIRACLKPAALPLPLGP